MGSIMQIHSILAILLATAPSVPGMSLPVQESVRWLGFAWIPSKFGALKINQKSQITNYNAEKELH
jgi:hypothetical protein